MADIKHYRRALLQAMVSQQGLPLSLSSEIKTSTSSYHNDNVVLPSSLSFPRFPELPTEIRLRIWRYCLPRPRVLEINYEERSGLFCSKYPPPIALRVCRESRAEALKHYELSFQSKLDSSCIYFDFSVDALHFKFGDLFSTVPPEDVLRAIGNDFARVKFLSCSLQGSRTFSVPYLPDLRAFPSLKELILLVPPGGHDGPDRVFVDPSTVTLSPSSNFQAIEFLRLGGNQVTQLWPDPGTRAFPNPKLSIMSYISGNYRVC